MSKGTCAGCGSTTSDYRSSRCRDCWRRDCQRGRRVSCVDCPERVSPRAYRCVTCYRAEEQSFLSAMGRDSIASRRARWTKRNRLDNAAPGQYNRHHRKTLLAKWQKQGRRCAYCLTGPAETVDHVIPLDRGGTNFEGNLAPACAPCNKAKWDNLLSAWRHGKSYRRPPVTWVNTEPKTRPAKKPQRWADPAPMFSVCVCGAAHARRSEFCSPGCAARTAYRRKVGIPDDLPHHANSEEGRRVRTQGTPPLRQAG